MLDNRTNPAFKDTVKICRQRDFNSYPEFLYELHHIQHRLDPFGEDGTWKKGDFHIHFPGMNLDQRTELFNKYSKEIVDTV